MKTPQIDTKDLDAAIQDYEAQMTEADKEALKSFDEEE